MILILSNGMYNIAGKTASMGLLNFFDSRSKTNDQPMKVSDYNVKSRL